MLVYKVLGEDLRSLVISPDNVGREPFYKDFCIQYKIGEWVKPNKEGTKIMVFQNLNFAKYFASVEKEYCRPPVIFECQAKNISNNGFIVDVPFMEKLYLELLKIKKSKKKMLPFYKHYQKQNIPYGTLFCSSLKLLNRVE